MKKVAFYTLGCKLNYSETSTLARQLKERGYRPVAFDQSPDIYVINTCSVTDNADRKCRKIVRDAQKHAPHAFIAIVGCYAQLKPQEIARIPGVDAVLGAAEKFQLVDLLEGFQKKSSTEVKACEIALASSFHPAYSMDDRTRTFLKVQDGCDYSCSFCTIPLARGKSRSDSISNAVAQAREIVAGGVKEIVLTGVNLGDFGIIEGARKYTFIDLMQAMDEIEGLQRIRISSIEPNLLSEEIIAWVAGSKKFVPHFHIPLQSGCDATLKRMQRRYLARLYEQKVHKIKETMPHCCIGADVIVGFPGETEAEFEETYRFIVKQPLDYLHVFTYSERVNTRAYAMDEIVPKSVRARRSKMLRNLSEKKRRAFYENHLGQQRQVLFENDVENGNIFGYTDNYIRVGFPYRKNLHNHLKEVMLSHIEPQGYVAGKRLLKATLLCN